MADNGPRLLIDEAEADLGSVWIHPQDDPYPGGHHYRLWLPEPLAGSWLSGGHQDLSALDMLLTFWRMEQGIRVATPWLYVLNTIEAVTPAGHGVQIRGECSPFITW